MLYQFVGDSVVGFFGIPGETGDDASKALACARSLVDIGAAVAEEWQRQIDQAEPAAGVHVGMAVGEGLVSGVAFSSATGHSPGLQRRITLSGRNSHASNAYGRRNHQQLSPPRTVCVVETSTSECSVR